MTALPRALLEKVVLTYVAVDEVAKFYAVMFPPAPGDLDFDWWMNWLGENFPNMYNRLIKKFRKKHDRPAVLRNQLCNSTALGVAKLNHASSTLTGALLMCGLWKEPQIERKLDDDNLALYLYLRQDCGLDMTKYIMSNGYATTLGYLLNKSAFLKTPRLLSELLWFFPLSGHLQDPELNTRMMDLLLSLGVTLDSDDLARCHSSSGSVFCQHVLGMHRPKFPHTLAEHLFKHLPDLALRHTHLMSSESQRRCFFWARMVS
jgi:hypothetical protein